MVFPNRPVDVREDRIETTRDARGLDVSGHLKEAQRVSLQSDEGFVLNGYARGFVVVDGGRGVFAKEGLDFFELDKDAASGLIISLNNSPARDLSAVLVVDRDLGAFLVEKGQLIEIDFATSLAVRAVIEASGILGNQGLLSDGSPSLNLCASAAGQGRLREDGKRGILDGGGYGDREGSNLVVIPDPVPGFRLLIFVALESDGGVLAEAGSDDDRGVGREEAVRLPMLRSTAYPVPVTLEDEVVELSEGFHVEPYLLASPGYNKSET